MLREPYLQITVKVKYILEVNKEILNVYLVHKDLRNNLESEYRYVISVHPVRRLTVTEIILTIHSLLTTKQSFLYQFVSKSSQPLLLLQLLLLISSYLQSRLRNRRRWSKLAQGTCPKMPRARTPSAGS